MQHARLLRDTFAIIQGQRMRVNPKKWVNPKKCIFEVVFDQFLGFIISDWHIEANLNKVQEIFNMKPFLMTNRQRK